MRALSGRLEPKNRAYAVQDFRHAVQSGSEAVSDYIRRIERTVHLAYGRDDMLKETREMILYSQLQECLLYCLMKSPAVSGAQTYSELCLAAKKPKTSHPDTSQCVCVCVYMHVVSLVYELIW